MPNKIQEEVPRLLELIEKEREWILRYGRDLRRLQSVVAEYNESEARRLTTKLANLERRVHLFQGRVLRMSKLFEGEFLSKGDESLKEVEKQLDLYESRLVGEDSRGLFGPKGKIPKLLKKKPIGWQELLEEVEWTYKEGVSPLVSVLDSLKEIFQRLFDEYLGEQKELAEKIEHAGKTKYNVFKTSKDMVEWGLNLRFDLIVSDLTKLGSPVRILDLGCGDGLCLKQIYNKYGNAVKLYGLAIKREEAWTLSLREYVDAVLFQGWSEYAKRRAKEGQGFKEFKELRPWNQKAITFRLGYAERLSKIFKLNFFHLIYSHHGGIMHANNLLKALDEARKVLKHRGMIVFDVSERQKNSVLKDLKSFKVVKEGASLAPTGQFTEVLHLMKE